MCWLGKKNKISILSGNNYISDTYKTISDKLQVWIKILGNGAPDFLLRTYRNVH